MALFTDITLGQYFPADSPVHRLDPRTKLLAGMLLMTGLIISVHGLVLLALTFLVGAITLGTGRTNMMQGAVHLVLFAAFLFLSMVP